MYDIFREAICEALEESKATLTNDVVDNITNWVQGCHENSNLCTGNTESPLIHQLSEKERTHKHEEARWEQRVRDLQRRIDDIKFDHRRETRELRNRIQELKNLIS